MSTKIEWVKNPDGSQGETWNPVSGCTKVSDGCKYCYAERQWPRLSAPGQPYEGRKFTDVQCHPERLNQPLRWRKRRMVFVNSMSDLFHPDVPFEFIASVFAIMSVTTRHTYQVLTKRPERMRAFFDWVLEDGIGPTDFCADDKIFDHWPKHIEWVPQRKHHGGYDNCGPVFPYKNVWLGVSVEDQATADERIPFLLETPAAVRFLSIEPLLGPIDLAKCGAIEWDSVGCTTPGTGEQFSRGLVDWVIVGGESGPKARPMHPDWAISIKDQCQAAGVPFFFKQGSQANWPDFRNPESFPPELRIREYPEASK